MDTLEAVENQIADEKAKQREAEEINRLQQVFRKARREAEDRAKQVIAGFNKHDTQSILIAFSNAFQEDGTLLLKVFGWRLGD